MPPGGLIRLPLVDISSLPPAERAAAVTRWANEAARQPFDLAVGPLLRTALLRLGPDDHRFLLTMHHIITDGWSMGIFFRELTAIYAAFATGQPSPLAPLPIQYADFALWQRDWLQGAVLQEQLGYWKRQLAGLPLLAMPTDHPRPPVLGARGASYRFVLPSSLAAGLRALSQQAGATLFMTLLAGFAALLAHYTGQTDVVVGAPTANRTRAELEGLIGFFVNTLVLRADLRDNPPFIELLGRVREAALGAYGHQDLPFEMLVEELHPERDLSRNPLFQITFQLQQAPGMDPDSAAQPAERGAATFDLALDMWDNAVATGGRVSTARTSSTGPRLSASWSITAACWRGPSLIPRRASARCPCCARANATSCSTPGPPRAPPAPPGAPQGRPRRRCCGGSRRRRREPRTRSP